MRRAGRRGSRRASRALFEMEGSTKSANTPKSISKINAWLGWIHSAPCATRPDRRLNEPHRAVKRITGNCSRAFCMAGCVSRISRSIEKNSLQ